MIAIRRKSDKVVVYRVKDGTPYEITESGFRRSGKARAIDIRPETHEAIEGVPEPETQGLFWFGGILSFDGVWAVAKAEVYATWAEEKTAEARTEAKAALVAWVNNFLKPFTASYPETEVLTWPMQSDYSRAFKDGVATAHQAAFITGMAEKRGITAAQMADLIIVKAGPYELAVQETATLRSVTFHAIDNATAFEIPAILAAAQSAAIAKAEAIGLI